MKHVTLGGAVLGQIASGHPDRLELLLHVTPLKLTRESGFWTKRRQTVRAPASPASIFLTH